MSKLQIRQRHAASIRSPRSVPAPAGLPLEPRGTGDATDCRSDRDAGDDANPFGLPGYLRRLSDKILAAFNHAYAAGEEEIAFRLHDALAAAEQQARLQYPERRAGRALNQAGLWIDYVDARNRYLGLTQGVPAERANVEAAEAAMTEAYRVWSVA
jgi:hypothetical protein